MQRTVGATTPGKSATISCNPRFKDSTMSIKSLRVIAIVFAALAMGMHLAHALELSPKLQWPAELYLPVQTSLYALFGRIGPVLEIGALLLVGTLAFRVRSDPA